MFELIWGIFASLMGFLFFKFPRQIAEGNAAWQHDNFGWKFSRKHINIDTKMAFVGGVLFMIIGVLTALSALVGILKK